MNLEPIQNASVVNEVVKRITDSIIKGSLLPGQKVPTEVELVEKLEIGRNSVREAIKMLCAMGILEVKRGHGTYVATKVAPSVFNPLVFSLIVEPKEGKELYELRAMFESMVLYLVIDKATDEDIRALETLLDQVSDDYTKGVNGIEYFLETDVAFHLALIKATHNNLVVLIGNTIMALFTNYIKTTLEQNGGIQNGIINHYKLLSVIKNRDKASVLDIVDNTLAEWKRQWEENIHVKT